MSRLPPDESSATIRSFMAHHQGMSLLALTYLLLDRPMQRRFLSDPYFKASELLLCERIPKVASPLQPHAAEDGAHRDQVRGQIQGRQADEGGEEGEGRFTQPPFEPGHRP